MDKNSVIGLVLITAIMLGWVFLSKPSEQELKNQKRIRDSIEFVNKVEELHQKEAGLKNTEKSQRSFSSTEDTLNHLSSTSDSLRQINLYGEFSSGLNGENKDFTLENENLKVVIASKGAIIKSVLLKNYKTFDKKPLYLFTEDSTHQDLEFITSNSHLFSTKNFVFTPIGQSSSALGKDSTSIAFRLYNNSKTKYLEFVYGIKGSDFMVHYTVNLVGMNDVIASNASDINLQWGMTSPSLERDIQTQRNASTIYYKYVNDEVANINPKKEEKKSLDSKVKWIGYKQQFFSSVLIADKGFEKPTDVSTSIDEASATSVKKFTSNLSIPYTHQNIESFGMQFYFGPNHYNTLKSYGIDLEKQINLGWSIFSYVNKWIVIPTFNFLSRFNLNYGIVILLLTIFIKLLLFPIAYKTYLSSAKMRVLKPEIDEINKKYGQADAMKKQQATMALYRQAGVNPLAGCIPVLLQLPILTALFSFFPSAIELRQQSFLWATDLSTYDSILDFAFKIPFYGNHISLFTLLMTISTILYTYSNSQLMGNNDQMPGMKFMMYAMPIIFLGVFNNYSAGLSYYYFLANMITFGQTYLMRKFIDEKALHAKIQENKRKPIKQSSFQKRLEEMAKQRQQLNKK